jgi:hypothetical protein
LITNKKERVEAPEPDDDPPE